MEGPYVLIIKGVITSTFLFWLLPLLLYLVPYATHKIPWLYLMCHMLHIKFPDCT